MFIKLCGMGILLSSCTPGLRSRLSFRQFQRPRRRGMREGSAQVGMRISSSKPKSTVSLMPGLRNGSTKLRRTFDLIESHKAFDPTFEGGYLRWRIRFIHSLLLLHLLDGPDPDQSNSEMVVILGVDQTASVKVLSSTTVACVLCGSFRLRDIPWQ